MGHLAQFGAFAKQGELLCTQGLAFILRHPDAERAFIELVNSATGSALSPGLNWRAESRQLDGGRPDLEGRRADGLPVVKVEAKLGAPLGEGQLDSYLTALCQDAGIDVGVLLVIVPRTRRVYIAECICKQLFLAGAGPWQMVRDEVQLNAGVVLWEEVFEVLQASTSGALADDVAQLNAMYRVLNGDDMEPLTSDEQVLAWRDREAWWETLVDLATRQLTPPDVTVLPFGTERGPQPYRRRYVCRRLSQVDSCYSVGIRDPFRNYRTPVWLRFNKGTGHFADITERLERSLLGAEAVHSLGDLWFPLEVPLNADRDTMIGALVSQVDRILAVAYQMVD
jgi:hypothetical protein